MFKFLKKFGKSDKGNIALSASILAVPIMLVSGVAVDFTIFTQTRSSLQEIADVAALASAKELSLTSSKDEVVKNVARQYVQSGLSSGFGVADDSDNVNIAADISKSRKDVTVDLSYVWTPMLIHYVMEAALPIKVQATASLAGSESVCVIALEKNASNAFTITGSSSSLTANDCAVYSNSSDKVGMGIVSGSQLRTASTYSGGGFTGPVDAYSPRPVTDSPAISDPLIDRSAPAFPLCKTSKSIYRKGNSTLSPCVFEGGLSLSGKATLSLSPGIYVIKDGPLELKGNSTIRGKNVGFYFTGEGATFDFGVSTQIDLTAPESGDMAGILFFEDRASSASRLFRIRSKDAERLEGTIYLPQGHFVVDKASRVGQRSNWTAIIARQIEIQQGPTIVINSDYANSDIPVPDGIGSAGDIRLSQ